MNYKLAAFADEADGRISGQIEAMKANGIGLLEIRGVDGTNIADLTEEKAKQVRAQLDAAGISVWSLGSPYGKISINDEFAPHLDKFKYGLELASILGAKNIRMFSFYVPSDAKAQYRDEVMRRLEQFISVSKGSGITLCHENEKGIYGDTAPYCEDIHKTFPELRAVFDPANFIQSGQDTIEAWERLHSYVEYMHIKDAFANGAVVPAGKGIGNLPYLLKRYQGTVLTLEPHLTVFEGFAALEEHQKTKIADYRYPSSRAAFDAAVCALKELI